MTPYEEAQTRANEIAAKGLTGEMFVTMSWGCEYCNSVDVEPTVVIKPKETKVNMNISDMTKLALNLLAHREELMKLVSDAVKLFGQFKAIFPDLLSQLGGEGTSAPAQDYSIQWLQDSLNKLTGANLKVDGNYGKATQDAVKKFQQQHGLTADGWAGAQTQAAILDALK